MPLSDWKWDINNKQKHITLSQDEFIAFRDDPNGCNPWVAGKLL
jgi:hypothetical protein